MDMRETVFQIISADIDRFTKFLTQDGTEFNQKTLNGLEHLLDYRCITEPRRSRFI